MVLGKPVGKVPVPGRPTNLDYSVARAYCAGGAVWTFFLSYIIFLYPFLGNGPIYTEILSQRAVKPKTTNQLCELGITWALI